MDLSISAHDIPEPLANTGKNPSFSQVKGKKICVLGFAYKPDTSDTRESPAISVCQAILSEGAKVAIYDPQVCVRFFAAQHDNNLQFVTDSVHRAGEHGASDEGIGRAQSSDCHLLH